MSIEIKITKNDAAKVREMKNILVARALEAVGLQAENYASMLSPVDTGNLKNSINHQVQNSEEAVYVGTNVEYAPYQELGTRRMKAANGGKGFLRPAIQDHVREYKAMIEQVLRNG